MGATDARDEATTGGRRVVAFIDIGTNSVRLLVVRISAIGAHTTLTQQKEVVRLGEGAFAEKRLQPEAMDRAALVCRHFSELARSYRAEPIVAVATSATRDATNKAVFVDRLQRESDLDVRVVSGREEARLIYLGVVHGLDLQGRQAVFIDVGGGSTEVIVGDQHEHAFLDSLSVGSIRLTGDIAGSVDVTQVVAPAAYKAIRQQVRYAASHTVLQARRFRIDTAYGTSGTILNLSAIARRTAVGNSGSEPEGWLSYAELKRVGTLLCSLPLEERRQVPGINPERADIIIAGAAILQALMQGLGIKGIQALAESGLREGLLVDYLEREGFGPLARGLSVRERSVLQLGRTCGFDETHAQTVARLAVELFDSARAAGLHDLGPRDRELLRHAALLHDIGAFLSYSAHHRHTYYLIRNADLLGFDQTDKAVVAAMALFHRKGSPTLRQPEFGALDERSRAAVRMGSVLLRLAESLDRSHSGVVSHARLLPGQGRELTLEIESDGDPQLEVWRIENRPKSLEKALGRRLTVRVVDVEAHPGA